MKRAKIFLIAVAVVFAAIAAGVIYTWNLPVEQTQRTESVSHELTGEQSEQSLVKTDDFLSDSEELTAVVSEEGVPTLNYTNMSCVSGVPDLVIPAKKDGIKVKTVNLTWLHSSENQPVTYIRSISFEEGIKILDSTLCYVTSLKKVCIPKSIKKIPDLAFHDCKDNVTLEVVKGSYGERYAKKENLKYEYMKKGEEKHDSVK